MKTKKIKLVLKTDVCDNFGGKQIILAPLGSTKFGEDTCGMTGTAALGFKVRKSNPFLLAHILKKMMAALGTGTNSGEGALTTQASHEKAGSPRRGWGGARELTLLTPIPEAKHEDRGLGCALIISSQGHSEPSTIINIPRRKVKVRNNSPKRGRAELKPKALS